MQLVQSFVFRKKKINVMCRRASQMNGICYSNIPRTQCAKGGDALLIEWQKFEAQCSNGSFKHRPLL